MSDPRLLDAMLDKAFEVVARITNERDEARNAARQIWMMFSYKEKEERDSGLSEWLRTNCPWLKDE